MLYRPLWDALSLRNLTAWLETMPADGTYRYSDGGGCLLHQYFSAAGVDIECVGGTVFWLKSGDEIRLPEAFAAAATAMTFGAALEGIRSALSAADH